MRAVLFLFTIFISSALSAQSGADNYSSEYAPNFQYVDDNGNVRELDDYKGKVIYISFWASWCQPCIQGFQKYSDTRQAVEDLGVVMLNISIDKNQNNWHQAMNKLDINGKHGIADKVALINDYELYSIPHYEIIGHDGKRLYLDRENGKTIVDNFKDFLARK